MKRSILVVAVLLVLSLAVSASANTLTVYSSVDEENARALLNAFTQSTGIDVRFVFLSSGPALARMEAEKNNPQADVWLGAPSENHVLAKDRGLTQPYMSPNAAALDAKFYDPEGYWTSFYMNPMGVAIHTGWAERAGIEMPESWYDLLKPEFRGEIQMPTPQSSGTAYNLVASMVLAWGEDEAFDYLKELHKNIQSYTQSGTAPSQAVAIGQAGVAIQFTPAFLKLMDEGYPLKLIFPKEGVGYEAPAVSIIKGAPNIEAAQALVDWLISVEGQNKLSELKTYFFPVHPEASTGEGLPAFSDIPTIDYDALWAGDNREYLVNKWIDEVLRGQ
ncbi:MAG: ABC transporter substrate-binding protein [Peptococcaceae bacterium 1109]|nr:MAG: ABC transporter substrate-binding protein [Peptococcaceae bacterium 1109]